MSTKSETKEVILPDSPLAAYKQPLVGWVSRQGRFYYGEDAERIARWDGSTHTKCEKCGLVMRKGLSLCGDCRDLEDRNKFYAMPEKEWDGKAMIYSQLKDEYFTSPSDALDSLEDDEVGRDLMLVICEPAFASLCSSHFEDILPGEEPEVPDELEAAVDQFNATMKGVVISWWPGKFRLKAQCPLS